MSEPEDVKKHGKTLLNPIAKALVARFPKKEK